MAGTNSTALADMFEAKALAALKQGNLDGFQQYGLCAARADRVMAARTRRLGKTTL